MEYAALTTDATIYEGVLPPYLCEMLRTKKMVLFGGLDESSEGKELVSMAAFSIEPFHADEVRLEYICVAEDWREQGFAEELLEYCEEKLSEAGISVINCKLCGDDLFLEDLLTDVSFVPVSNQGHFLEYQLSDLLQSEVTVRIPTGLTETVIAVTNRDDIRLKKFLALAAEHNCYMDRKRFDTAYSRFYCEKGEIKACMLMEQADGHTLFLHQAYTAADCEQKAAYAFLFADALKQAGEHMPEDTVVQVQTFSEKEYLFLQKVTKEAQKDNSIMEFAKILDVKG